MKTSTENLLGPRSLLNAGLIIILLSWKITAARAADVYWTNSSGGNWSNPANWDSGTVPGSTDNVFIISNGTYTVTLDVNALVQGLAVGGDSGQQTYSFNGNTLTLNGTTSFNTKATLNLNGGTLYLYTNATVNGPVTLADAGGLYVYGALTVNGTMNWANATVAGTGVTTFGPGSVVTLSGSGDKLYQCAVNNQGTVVLTGGAIGALQSAVFNNQAGGLFDIQSNGNVAPGDSSTPVFNNAGTLRKSAGTGKSLISLAFNNSGTVDVQSGQLWLSGGGTNSGPFTVASGTELWFVGGTHLLNSSSSLGGAGSVRFGSGTVTVAGSYNIGGSTTWNGGWAYLQGPVVNLGSALINNGGGLSLYTNATINGSISLGGGSFYLYGDFALNGTMSWSAGLLAGSGVTTFGPGSVVTISGSGEKSYQGTVNNQGTVVLADGGIGALQNAVFNNQAGGLFDIQSDRNVAPGDGSTPVFNNAGTLRKSAGTGKSLISLAFNNSGTVDVQSGQLWLGGGGTNSGPFTVASGAELWFVGGTHLLNSSSSLSGAGTVHYSSGTITVAGSYNFDGSTILSGATLFLNTNATLNGPVSLLGNVSLYVNGTLAVNGTMNWANATVAGTGVTTFGPGSVVTLSGSSDKLYQCAVNNQGTVVWSGGNIGASLSAMFNNQAGGLFDIQSDGQLVNYDSSTPVFNNAGTLRKSAGTGTTLFGGVMVNNSGTVDVQSGTIQATASFSNGPSSILNFPVRGISPAANFGQLIVGGDLKLGGVLNATVTNGFVPSVGDSFRLINWGTHKGGFSAANGFDLGNGLYLQGIADSSGLSLVTKTTKVPTPPPPTNLVNQAVAFGDTAVFSFSPSGVEPFNYQWTFYGTNLLGQTNASLIITNVQALNLGTYCAIVADALGVTNIYCADLSAITAPGIASQPNGQTVVAGTTINLTATGNGGAPLRYQWRINGENIPDATNSTYTITNAQPRDGGTYSVLVANPVRVISSSNAKVLVISPALPFSDSFAARGTNNTFSGVGSGTNTNATHETGEPSHAGKSGTHSVWLQWTAPANGVASFNTRGSSFDTLLGIYTSTNSIALTNLIAAAADDDRGGYFTSEAAFNAVTGTNYFIAVDGLSSASGDIVLSWNLDTNITQIPRIFQQPVDVTVSVGSNATFSVFAASITNLSYQWYLGDWLAIPGATTNTLTLTNVTYLDVGAYSVEVTSAAGQVVESLSASLEIGPSSDTHSFDKLEDLLANLPIGGGGGGFAPLSKRGHGVTAQSLSFPSVSSGSIGSQIINNFNSTTEQGEPIHSDVIGGSSRWYLLTADTNGTLVIDTLGSDIATVLSVYVGGDILSLTKVASDRNGAPDGVRSLVRFSAKPNTNYLIAVDGVNGAQGNINLNWRLGTPPNPSGPVQSLIINGGAGLSLNAGISNNVTSPFYQWRRNGANISGATNSTYTLPNVRYDQVGSYSVLVSNLVGQVINSIATVSAQSPLGLVRDTPASFRITGSATQATVLQLSTNLSVWTPLYTNSSPLLPVSYLDPNSPARPKGFYRLQPWP